MSVVMMSTELVLSGKWHRSHWAVSIGKPGEVLGENKFAVSCGNHNISTDSWFSDFFKHNLKQHGIGGCLQAYLPPSCFFFTMWLMLLTVRLTAMSLLSPERKNEFDHSITPWESQTGFSGDAWWITKRHCKYNTQLFATTVQHTTCL